MNLPRLAISRHVLAATFSLVIVLLGVVSYGRLGVDRNPDIEFPTLTISTDLAGATPETVAQTVTQPLESRLNTISGIDTLSSTSTTGRSSITVTFDADKNIAEALNDVQSRVSQARRELPEDAGASVVQKFDINAEPVMWLTLSGQKGALELTAVAKQLQKRLETISGVGEVRLRGETERMLAVTLHEDKLASLALTYADVRNAFGAHHLNTAGGRLKTQGREYQVALDFEFTDAQSLGALPVASREGRVIRLSELAHIEETSTATRGFARYNGQGTVALGVVKASGSNPVEVIDAVRERVQTELAPSLAAGLSLEVVSDEAKPIEEIVGALQSHLLEGTLLTALVVWLFLRSLRATTIIATAIPVSLLGAIAALFFAGYTFNSFTLLALLLLIGVVVDDAIVVLESIYKTKEHFPEMSIQEAAEKGSSEVMFAVMAATLTLVCVFGPVVFLPGILGQFFQSFAVTVVAGVLVSWFVSMTLTPMLCAKFLKVEAADTGIYGWLEVAFRRMDARYLGMLRTVLQRRKLVLMLSAATLLPAAVLFTIVDKEFSPEVDEGRISVFLNLPSGKGQEELLTLAQQAEALIADVPELSGVLTTFNDGGRSGTDSVSMSITLKDTRSRSQKEVMADLESRLSEQPQWRSSVRAGASGGGGAGGPPLQFFLQGPDYSQLVEQARKFQDQVSSQEGLRGLRNNLNTGLPQLSVVFDRSEASRAGVAPRDVAVAVAALTGQTSLGRYTGADGERHDIVMRGSAGLAPESVNALSQAKVRASSGELLPLGGFVRLSTEGAPSALQRVNQQFAVSFSASPQGSLGDAVSRVTSAARELPPGLSLKFSGQSEEFRKVGGNLGLMFALALVLLYLVLASQFNSYSQPLLVMLAQPLAVIGGIGGLALTGQSLNIYSMIGLILLVGLVAKNSILLVDRANQLRGTGLPVDEALTQACPERLRPVLMTSLTVILAMLPAALGLGAGAENNQPLSVAIIGGMVSSTLLTLLVVPAAYSLFGKPRRG